MDTTVEQFLARCEESGLLSAAEVALYRNEIPPEKRGEDAQPLAKKLVQNRKLTKYQAAAIYQGKTRGLVLGSYVVQDKIGAGGMGEVYKAQHRRLERLAAIKVLPARKVESADAIKRFHQEVKAAAKLSHPNIVITHDADEADGIHYLVMEYIEGRDLGEVVKRDGREELAGGLPVKLVVDCLLQAAQGLVYAHGRGIVHRDIKPRNLLLDNHGTLKILDMGLARDDATALDDKDDDDGTANEEITRVGQIMGSVDFMSPEQAVDSHQVDARSDIYSLGCTLFALLTSKTPYPGESVIKKILNHREQPIPTLRSIRPDVPPRLEALFQRMMAKKPEGRPANMAAVVAELAAIQSDLLAPAERPLSTPSVIRAAPATARSSDPGSGSSISGEPGSRLPLPPPPQSTPAASPQREPAIGTAVTEARADDTDRSHGPTLVDSPGEVLDAEIVFEEPATPVKSFPISPNTPGSSGRVAVPRAGSRAPRPVPLSDATANDEGGVSVGFSFSNLPPMPTAASGDAGSDSAVASPNQPASPGGGAPVEFLEAEPAEPSAAATTAAEPPPPPLPQVPSGPSPILVFLGEHGIVIMAIATAVVVLMTLALMVFGVIRP